MNVSGWDKTLFLFVYALSMPQLTLFIDRSKLKWMLALLRCSRFWATICLIVRFWLAPKSVSFVTLQTDLVFHLLYVLVHFAPVKHFGFTEHCSLFCGEFETFPSFVQFQGPTFHVHGAPRDAIFSRNGSLTRQDNQGKCKGSVPIAPPITPKPDRK